MHLNIFDQRITVCVCTVILCTVILYTSILIHPVGSTECACCITANCYPLMHFVTDVTVCIGVKICCGSSKRFSQNWRKKTHTLKSLNIVIVTDGGLEKICHLSLFTGGAFHCSRNAGSILNNILKFQKFSIVGKKKKKKKSTKLFFA